MLEEKDLELTVIEQSLGILETNAIDIKAFVENKVLEYVPENYVDQADAAKADRAVLNKAALSLDEKRKEIEKKFMSPFEKFKATITETVKIIKGASGKLDEIVKEEEAREKDVKRRKIETYFNGLNFKLLPLEKLYDEKWLNKTVTDKKWKTLLDDKISNIYEDIKTLESFTEDVDILKSIYLDTLNIGITINKGNDLKAHREALKEEAENRLHREREANKDKALDQIQAEVFEDIKENHRNEMLDMATEGEIKTDPNPIVEVTLRFKGRQSDIIALKRYMAEHYITYEKIYS